MSPINSRKSTTSYLRSKIQKIKIPQADTIFKYIKSNSIDNINF